MNEINFKKFYPVNLEKKKDEINDFWNQIFKEVGIPALEDNGFIHPVLKI